MFLFHRVQIRSYEVGLHFVNDEFHGLLDAGSHWLFDPLGRVRVEVVSLREPWLIHEQLDEMVRSGELAKRAQVVDLKDHQRALVWIDGRFDRILPAGLWAYWIGRREVRVEIVDTRSVRFVHDDLPVVAKWAGAHRLLDVCAVQRNHVGVLFQDGRFVDTLQPGLYAFWRGAADVNVMQVGVAESMIDVGGQEIMTSDKVTLRLNAVVGCRVVDARRAVTSTADPQQALYREAQLVLRAVVGARELDAFLTDKDVVANELAEQLRVRAGELGLEVVSVGVRDVILPGDMKELMNRVTEAKKAAEANLISRREETAAMRSQANTAKLLADNPTLMRLRELEVLEKIAAEGKLNIVLGEKGLAERVVNLL